MIVWKLNKGWRWTIGILTVLSLSGIAIHLALEFYLSPVIKHYAHQTIYEQSQGTYQLDSLEVEWNVFRSSLTIRDLAISSDPTSLQMLQDSTKPRLPYLKAFFPQIQLDRLNLLELYCKRKLHIGTLHIYAPTLFIAGFVKNEDSLAQNLLTKFFPKPLSSILINQLRIEGGQLQLPAKDPIYQRGFKVDEIRLEIKNFYLDSAELVSPSQSLFAKDFQLSGKLDDYPLTLIDENYTLNLGHFTFSKTKRELKIKNIQLAPLDTTNEQCYPKRSLVLPLMSISGIDIEAFLKEQQLRLSELRIVHAAFSQVGKSVDLRASKAFNLQLPTIISDVYVDSIVFEAASYHLYDSGQDSIAQISIRKINMVIDGVKIRDRTFTSQQLLSYFEEANLSANEVDLLINHDTHKLSTEQILFSAKQGQVQLKHLRLKPLSAKGMTHIDAEVPVVEIDHINLARLLTKNELWIGQLNIEQPHINIHQYWSSDSQLVLNWARVDGYDYIKGVLDELHIRKLKVNWGSVGMHLPQSAETNTFKAKAINLAIQEFKLNAGTHKLAGKPFFASDIDIDFNIEDYSFVLPDSSYKFQASKIGFSANDSTFYADSLWVLPLIPASSLQAKEPRISILAPHFRMKGFDFYKAYFYRDIVIDSVWVQTPFINWKTNLKDRVETDYIPLAELELYPIIAPFVRSIKLKHFSFEQATIFQETRVGNLPISRKLPNIALRLEHFLVDSTSHISPERLLYSEKVELRIDQLSQKLPDSVHHLFVKEIVYTTDDKHIFIDSIYLKNEAAENIAKVDLYDVFISEINMNGIDPISIYSDKHLYFDDLQIHEPVIKFVDYREEVKEDIDSLAKTDLYQLIAAYLHDLEISTLVIRGGEVYLRKHDEDEDEAFHADDLFVMIRDFRLDSSSWANPSKPFYAKDIDIGMDANNYSFVLPDSTYELQIGHIGVSTADSTLFASDIQLLARQDKIQEKNPPLSWAIEIPQLHLKGFKPDEIYFHQKVRLDRLRISRPHISMKHLLPAQTTRHDPYKVYQFIASHFQELFIADLFVDQASFEEIPHPQDSAKPIVLNGLSVRALNITPDSSDFLSPDHLFYSKDVRLSIKNYDLAIEDIMYQLHFDELGVHTASDQLYARGLSFIPQYDQASFFDKFGYVRDQLEIDVPDVKVERLDLHGLFHEQKFRAGNLLLQGLSMRIFKDKNYPENPDKSPPMPQDMIRDLPFYLHLDTVEVADGTINFEQSVPDLKKNARFDISRIHANITNLSNDSLLIAQHIITELDAQATLMKSGQLKILYRFPMADTTNSYEFNGRVGRMDFAEFNPLLEQTAFVFVTSGQVNYATFSVKGSKRYRKRKAEYIYKGKMKLQYHDLKLAVIDKKSMFEQEKEIHDEKKMVSFLANTLVRKNNPRSRSRFLRVGKIYYKRETHRGIAGHWVKAMVSGVRSSVGLDNKDERERLFARLGKKNKKKEASDLAEPSPSVLNTNK